MNTKLIGDISEACVLAALLKKGVNVLIPFGDRNRYDLVIERDGKFERIQIKTGRELRGSLVFSTRSMTTCNGRWVGTSYKGQIDTFAVYHRENDSVYLVPALICAQGTASLRLLPRSSRGIKGLRATEFLVH